MESETICSKSQLGDNRTENTDLLGRLVQVQEEQRQWFLGRNKPGIFDK